MAIEITLFRCLFDRFDPFHRGQSDFLRGDVLLPLESFHQTKHPSCFTRHPRLLRLSTFAIGPPGHLLYVACGANATCDGAAFRKFDYGSI